MRIITAVIFVAVLSGLGLYLYSSYGYKIFRESIEVELVSHHEGAQIYLAKLNNLSSSEQQKVTRFKDWLPVEEGKHSLKVGGVYYKLALTDGRTKYGLLEVSNDTKRIVLK